MKDKDKQELSKRCMPDTEKLGFAVFWTPLLERSVPEVGTCALLDVAMVAGANGCTRISIPYMRVDWARNMAARAFLDREGDPNDVLIMLDCDHKHPHDILLTLAGHDPSMGVVGALAFRRGPPYEPMMFLMGANGRLRSPAEWEPGQCYQVDAVGTAAIAIRRWVFAKLDEAGHTWPYFQFQYPEWCGFNLSEDIYFCNICRDAGIPMFCNTGIVTPHLGTYLIDDKLWFEQNVKNVDLASYEEAIEGKDDPGDDGSGIVMPAIQTRVDA